MNSRRPEQPGQPTQPTTPGGGTLTPELAAAIAKIDAAMDEAADDLAW